MRTKYGTSIEDSLLEEYKKTMINMVYKLLPIREEGSDWSSYLDSIISEITGFDRLFNNQNGAGYVKLVSKLEGLKELVEDEDFYLYRKIVFECTNLIK